MKIKWFFKRYALFIIILLLLIPLLLSLAIPAPYYYDKLRTVFLLQRFYIIFSTLVLILLIIAYPKIEKYKPRKWGDKKTLVSGALTILFFILAFSTQLDYDKILSEGISAGGYVNLDSSRWLAPRILTDADPVADLNRIIFQDSEKLRREVFIKNLNNIPQTSIIIMNSFWNDANGDGVLSDCKVWLEVNSNKIDISDSYEKAASNEKIWIRVTVPKTYLREGLNELVLSKECPDAIAITTQTTYTPRQSAEFKEEVWTYPSYNEFVMTIKQKNSFLFTLLFKLGFIFRVLASICLFITVFSYDFMAFLFKKAKLELGFAFIYSIFMYWFAVFIRGYWHLLSKVVAYATYVLLKISFLKPTIDLSSSINPIVGPQGFALGIADTCSGIESIGYFILAYSALVIINWKRIDIKKALLLFIPGLFGTILVNILRIYLLFIIAVKISPDFAINTYHTNAGLVLFIIYFLLFWLLSQKFIKKITN
jgi:exosortase/archaeosortase family protein